MLHSAFRPHMESEYYSEHDEIADRLKTEGNMTSLVRKDAHRRDVVMSTLFHTCKKSKQRDEIFVVLCVRHTVHMIPEKLRATDGHLRISNLPNPNPVKFGSDNISRGNSLLCDHRCALLGLRLSSGLRAGR